MENLSAKQITNDLINKINDMNIPGIVATSAQLQEQKKQQESNTLLSGGYQGKNWGQNWNSNAPTTVQSLPLPRYGTKSQPNMSSQELYDYFVKGMETPARTNPLEEIINIMFSQEEKQQILIDAGWEFYKGNSGADMMRNTEGEFVAGLHFGYAFLQVITNKFKNLLLLKPTIKVKL